MGCVEMPLTVVGPSQKYSSTLRVLALSSLRVAQKTVDPGNSMATEWLEISVSDTGIGIPADQIERIFQPFTQVDESYTREFAGTGLGLAISQRLVHLMGGKITVESQVGQGSTFTIHLPRS